jgi:hypothetical protein
LQEEQFLKSKSGYLVYINWTLICITK